MVINNCLLLVITLRVNTGVIEEVIVEQEATTENADHGTIGHVQVLTIHVGKS